MSVAVAACGSVPDITFGVPDGGTSGSSGASGSSSGPCVPSGPEICDDGIDNDCNGQTDCADAACQSGFTCVDGAPDETWQLAALADGARPSCPSGYGAGKDVRTVLGTAADTSTCACDCGGTTACAGAGVDAAFGADNNCSGPTQKFLVRACEPLPPGAAIIGNNTFAKATTGTSLQCNANPLSAPTPLKDGRLCAAPPRVGGGCKSSQVCVPRTNNGYALCITKPGISACRGSYSVPRRAGSNANDTRGCSGCTCASSPCTAQVALYDNKDCDNAPRLTLETSPLPGACTPKANGGFVARAYTTTVSGGCTVSTPPQPTGSLSFGDERTICCAGAPPGGGGQGPGGG